MNLEADNIIGIVGGMGPQAGLVLFDNIIRQTQASSDQQHCSVILMSLPKHIVDRTAFIEGTSYTNPAYNIAGIIERLEGAGAKIIGIACNTAHSPEIYDVIVTELEKMNSQVHLVNMPLEICRFIKENYTEIRRVGVMTTNGTYKSKMYKKLLSSRGYDVIVPDAKFQDDVIHKMIYDPHFGIKANPDRITEETRILMEKAISYFKTKDVQAVILGCTELSLLFSGTFNDNILLIDSTTVFAKALLREASQQNENLSIPKTYF